MKKYHKPEMAKVKLSCKEQVLLHCHSLPHDGSSRLCYEADTTGAFVRSNEAYGP